MNYLQTKEFILNKLDGLPSRLTYHGKHHTIDVLEAAEEIIKYQKIDSEMAHLFRVSVLMHDTGFLEVYANHEEKGCEYAREWLPKLGYSNEQIDVICGMIMATKIPHKPQNDLERYICDADLDYLGTENYDSISESSFIVSVCL